MGIATQLPGWMIHAELLKGAAYKRNEPCKRHGSDALNVAETVRSCRIGRFCAAEAAVYRWSVPLTVSATGRTAADRRCQGTEGEHAGWAGGRRTASERGGGPEVGPVLGTPVG